MGELIALLVIILVVTPILVIAFNYCTIKNAKKSSILFKATVRGANATPEEVLRTIEDTGVTINFLKKTK